MYSLRLNCLLWVVLDTSRSGFLGTTRIDDAQLDIEWDIIPASSSCLSSWSTKSWYFSRTEYSLHAIGGLSVGISNSIRLVLPMSVAD